MKSRRDPSILSPVRVFAALWLLLPAASAGDVSFGPPAFLPGDTGVGRAAGNQEEVEIAAGGGGFLAVWSDCRSSLDDTNDPDGTGYDIFGALLDGAGNVMDSFVIDEGPGNQTLPHVAWNGTHWLVAWMEPTPAGLPTYERIRGVRIAPGGAVLDSTPIQIHQESDGCYCSFLGLSIAGGGTDGWVVVFKANSAGLRAVRVQADGAVPQPESLLVSNAQGLSDFDIAFATDEYVIVSGNGVQATAKRYSSTLQFLGTTALPFAREIASDGTNFLVTGQWFYSWPPKVEALLLGHDGSILVPRFTVKQGTSQSSPNGEGVGFDGTNYWVTWGFNQAARVSTAGAMLDPEGGFTLPFGGLGLSWPTYDAAPGGGLQYVWNDGLGGAGYPRDVHTVQVTPSGQLLDEASISVSPPAQVEPDFAEGDGVNVVVFRSRSSDSARILAQRLDDTGAVLDVEPIEVASGPVQWLSTPSIDAPKVAWNGSVFMVAWSDTIDVLARRMNPDGSFVDASPLVILPGQGAAVGALGADFLVAGSTVGTLLAPGALRASRVDGVSGAVLDAPPTTLSAPSLTARYPHIVTLGDRWLVVWQSAATSQYGDPSLASGSMTFVAADGTLSGPFGTGVGWRPNVAVAGDRALLVGVDGTLASAKADIEGRILLADGTFLGPGFLISDAFDRQLMPAATWDGTQFLVAWEDKRNSVIYFDERTDIYGARVTSDGSVLDPDGLALQAEPQVEIRPTFLTVGDTTLMAVSTLRTDDASTQVFRLGLHEMEGEAVVCQTDLGFGGPGASTLSVCGGDLSTGTSADLQLSGAPASTTAFVFAGLVNAPASVAGGQLVPNPWTLVRIFLTDSSGSLLLPGIPGGGGPFSAHVQAVVVDGAQSLGYGFSNAVQVDFLP